MWIGAHPDDETALAGVLLAKASLELNNSCHLISFTAGKYGGCHPNSLQNGTCPCPDSNYCPDTMAVARSKEFSDMAQFIGAECRVLNWDDAFLNGQVQYFEQAVDTVIKLIRSIKPSIVITHASNGGYGKQDHIYVNQIVRKAYQTLPLAERPDYLYYAIHILPDGIDTEQVTDSIDGRAYSIKLARTYWESVIDASRFYQTQGLDLQAQSITDTYHWNGFYLAGSH